MILIFLVAFMVLFLTSWVFYSDLVCVSIQMLVDATFNPSLACSLLEVSVYSTYQGMTKQSTCSECELHMYTSKFDLNSNPFKDQTLNKYDLLDVSVEWSYAMTLGPGPVHHTTTGLQCFQCCQFRLKNILHTRTRFQLMLIFGWPTSHYQLKVFN